MIGDNLLDMQVQNETLADIYATNPYCVIIGFPCDPFSPISNMQPVSTVIQKREGFQHLLFVARVWITCKKRGGHLLLENRYRHRRGDCSSG